MQLDTSDTYSGPLSTSLYKDSHGSCMTLTKKSVFNNHINTAQLRHNCSFSYTVL